MNRAAPQPVLSRFTSQGEATGSRAWNRRQRDPYPEDYERTLAAHAAWKAEQANAAIQARIDQAAEETEQRKCHVRPPVRSREGRESPLRTVAATPQVRLARRCGPYE